jgi:signal transduction histidine kinase/ActR/RegA family two-component response regulator/ABC-type uncharacterized transport system substrate-binding protein
MISPAVAKTQPPINDFMKRILVLNSYHPGYVWGESVNKGIRSVLDSSDSAVNIRYEYMDTKYLRPAVVFERLRQLYKVKYQEFQFDVIIATDNNALTFLVRYRDDLFLNTPVVFCGINGFNDNMLKGVKGFTGFDEKSDFRGTLELALKIHPKTQNVALVSGTSTSSLINQDRMKKIFFDMNLPINLIDLSLHNPDQLRTELQILPPHTIIMYLSYYRMADGNFLTVKESTTFVFNHSKLPMYSPWEYTMGNGIVGGMMLSGEKEGRRSAGYALKILAGTPVDDLPIVYKSEISPVFDHQMLRHFNISSLDLPENAIIKNEPQNFYYRYKYWIWAIALFICYQTLVIIWLSHNLIQRKRAEKLQKTLETQLLHSQKMEAIGTFAGGIAHDLNNILGAIDTCGEIALEETPSSNPVHKDLQHILNATSRGKSLISQILNFSRKKEFEQQPVNMNDMVNESLDFLQQIIPSSIQIRVDLCEKTKIVFANPAKIQQIIINLCTNGVQAMGGKQGVLSISLSTYRAKKDKKSQILDLKPGSYACLKISDTGSGMSPQLQNRIFEPFYTTRAKTEGTGLGLAIVHGIVTGYNGKIAVDSELDKGSTFSIYLPCKTREVKLVADEIDSPSTNGAEHIILVDDDLTILYAGEKIFLGAGYTVTSFESADMALEAIKKNPNQFDLLVTDLVMPGMTGIELIEKYKSIRPDIPALLCSGHESQADRTGIDKNEFGNFLKKPYTATQLLQQARKSIDSNQTGSC